MHQIRLCRGSFFRFIGNSPINCNELVKVIFAINELQIVAISTRSR